MADTTDTPKVPEMVERVARAIMEAESGQRPCSLEWRDYEDTARAALVAMREPTEAMLEAVVSRDSWPDPGALWCAMIDAALR